ncbi:MAG: hypothetical protein HZB71_01815 [Betaproteobacteria bacterium]|nr:hypothetical protein [Betaproteobacteria bacterium]
MVTRCGHAPTLHAPWFADPADGVTLHRYLDEQFVPRFLQDAQAGRLTRNADSTWRDEDRFAYPDHPTLRLPMHRAFYLACCEVSCDAPGLPALDPARVVSAGLVVRRGAGATGAMRWMVRESVPQGWQGGAVPDYEPDEYRRLRQRKLVAERFPEPAYSGEETGPMHPLHLRVSHAGGFARTHTLLWGYVPLGGAVRVDGPASAPAEEPDYAAEYAWPVGSQGEADWAPEHGQMVQDGLASEPLRQLLDALLNRYRAQDAANPDNEALRTLLGLISFLDAEAKPACTLLAYLERRAEPLMEWLSRIEREEQNLDDWPLPAHDGADEPESEAELDRMEWSLALTELQAGFLRELLILRARSAVAANDHGIAIPRFGQEQDDVFHVRVFLRYRTEGGCERTLWGPASQPFRVASPLEPQAQRPILVALPDLADLKRGGPRGITFHAPKALADKLRRLKFKMDVEEGGPGNPAGACFGFSFSLPIITLCAMILLMIVLNLLNFLFRWLPFAFLAIPRLCLRALGKTGGGS